jgi:hypothetical protein
VDRVVKWDDHQLRKYTRSSRRTWSRSWGSVYSVLDVNNLRCITKNGNQCSRLAGSATVLVVQRGKWQGRSTFSLEMVPPHCLLTLSLLGRRWLSFIKDLPHVTYMLCKAPRGRPAEVSFLLRLPTLVVQGWLDSLLGDCMLHYISAVRYLPFAYQDF